TRSGAGRGPAKRTAGGRGRAAAAPGEAPVTPTVVEPELPDPAADAIAAANAELSRPVPDAEGPAPLVDAAPAPDADAVVYTSETPDDEGPAAS
ncbi:MAG: hypothetical protein ACJ74O_12195, partial [Frankiaceae bacterium]